jgi:hypothetical protein
MLQNNKKCIFFKPLNYMVSDSLVYETQLFGITQIISMRYLSYREHQKSGCYTTWDSH